MVLKQVTVVMVLALMGMGCGPLRHRNAAPQEPVVQREAASQPVPQTQPQAASTQTHQRNAVPCEQMRSAQVVGMPASIRTWADQVDRDFQDQCLGRALEQRWAYHRAHRHEAGTSLNLLCLSGGGEDGAFGAGLICGWSEKGDRPQFDVVTGVSTGALMAPMVFLGKSYDPQLRELYTRYSRQDLVKTKFFFTAWRSDAFWDSDPLRRSMTRIVNDTMLQDIAREHQQGRRLLIATTNLDAQRSMIWDMGAIACSSDPRKAELFRSVLLASAAIPGLLPPVYVDVQANGASYDEMHVDGGAISQVFLWGQKVDLRQLCQQHGMADIPPVRMFVVQNSKLTPEWKATKPLAGEIATQSLLTLVKSQARRDILGLYATAQEYHFEFRLACIPASFHEEHKEAFDRKYMNKLFQAGFELGKAGYHWEGAPL